jgi:signal recognition particle GTPase
MVIENKTTIEKILQTWTLAGQQRFAFMANDYIKGAEIYFFIHDINKNAEQTKEYLSGILLGCDFSSCKLAYVVGTKTDVYLKENEIGYVAPSNFIDTLIPNIPELIPKIDKNMILLSNNNTESVSSLYNYIADDISTKFNEKNDKKQFIKAIFMGMGGVGKTTTSRNLTFIGNLMSDKCGINPDEKMTIAPDIFLIRFQYDKPDA